MLPPQQNAVEAQANLFENEYKQPFQQCLEQKMNIILLATEIERLHKILLSKKDYYEKKIQDLIDRELQNKEQITKQAQTITELNQQILQKNALITQILQEKSQQEMNLVISQQLFVINEQYKNAENYIQELQKENQLLKQQFEDAPSLRQKLYNLEQWYAKLISEKNEEIQLLKSQQPQVVQYAPQLTIINQLLEQKEKELLQWQYSSQQVNVYHQNQTLTQELKFLNEKLNMLLFDNEHLKKKLIDIQSQPSNQTTQPYYANLKGDSQCTAPILYDYQNTKTPRRYNQQSIIPTDYTNASLLSYRILRRPQSVGSGSSIHILGQGPQINYPQLQQSPRYSRRSVQINSIQFNEILRQIQIIQNQPILTVQNIETQIQFLNTLLQIKKQELPAQITPPRQKCQILKTQGNDKTLSPTYSSAQQVIVKQPINTQSVRLVVQNKLQLPKNIIKYRSFSAETKRQLSPNHNIQYKQQVIPQTYLFFDQPQQINQAQQPVQTNVQFQNTIPKQIQRSVSPQAIQYIQYSTLSPQPPQTIRYQDIKQYHSVHAQSFQYQQDPQQFYITQQQSTPVNYVQIQQSQQYFPAYSLSQSDQNKSPINVQTYLYDQSPQNPEYLNKSKQPQQPETLNSNGLFLTPNSVRKPAIQSSIYSLPYSNVKNSHNQKEVQEPSSIRKQREPKHQSNKSLPAQILQSFPIDSSQIEPFELFNAPQEPEEQFKVPQKPQEIPKSPSTQLIKPNQQIRSDELSQYPKDHIKNPQNPENLQKQQQKSFIVLNKTQNPSIVSKQSRQSIPENQKKITSQHENVRRSQPASVRSQDIKQNTLPQDSDEFRKQQQELDKLKTLLDQTKLENEKLKELYQQNDLNWQKQFQQKYTAALQQLQLFENKLSMQNKEYNQNIEKQKNNYNQLQQKFDEQKLLLDKQRYEMNQLKQNQDDKIRKIVQSEEQTDNPQKQLTDLQVQFEDLQTKFKTQKDTQLQYLNKISQQSDNLSKYEKQLQSQTQMYNQLNMEYTQLIQKFDQQQKESISSRSSQSKEINQYQQKITQLQLQINETSKQLKDKINSLQSQLLLEQEQHLIFKKQQENVQRDFSIQKTQNLEIENLNNSLRQQLIEKEQQIKEVQIIIINKTQIIQQLENQLKDIQTQNTSTSKQMQALNQIQVENLKKQLQQEQSRTNELNDQISRFQQNVFTLEQQLQAERQTNILMSQEKQNNAIIIQNDYQQQNQQLEIANKELQQKLKQIEQTQQRERENFFNQSQQQIITIQNKYQMIQAKSSQEQEEQVNNLKFQIEQLKLQNEDLSNQIMSIKSNYEIQMSTMNTMASSKLINLEKQLFLEKEQKENSSMRILQLEKQVADFQNTIKSDQTEELRNNIGNLEDQILKIQKESDLILSSKQRADEEIKILNVRINELSNLKNQNEFEIMNLKSKQNSQIQLDSHLVTLNQQILILQQEKQSQDNEYLQMKQRFEKNIQDHELCITELRSSLNRDLENQIVINKKQQDDILNIQNQLQFERREKEIAQQYKIQANEMIVQLNQEKQIFQDQLNKQKNQMDKLQLEINQLHQSQKNSNDEQNLLLQQQIINYKNQINNLNINYQKSNQEMDDLNLQIQQLNMTIADLESQNWNLKQQIAQIIQQNQVNQQETQINVIELRSVAENSEDQIKDLTLKLEFQIKETQRYQMDAFNQEQQAQSLQKKMSDMNLQNQKNKQEYQIQIEELIKQINQKETLNQQTQQNAQALPQIQNTHLIQENEDLLMKIGQYEQMIKSLQEEYQKQQNDFQKLNKEYRNLINQSDKTVVTISQYQQQQDNIKRKDEQIRQMQQQIQDQQKKFESERNRYQDEINRLNIKNQEISNQIQNNLNKQIFEENFNLKNQIQLLQQELKNTPIKETIIYQSASPTKKNDEEIAKYKQYVNQLQLRMNQIASDYNLLEQQTESEKGQLEKQIKSLQDDSQKQQNENNQQQRQIEGLQRQIQQFQKNLQNDVNQELEFEFKKLKSQFEITQLQYKQIQEELNQAKSQIFQYREELSAEQNQRNELKIQNNAENSIIKETTIIKEQIQDPSLLQKIENLNNDNNTLRRQLQILETDYIQKFKQQQQQIQDLNNKMKQQILENSHKTTVIEETVYNNISNDQSAEIRKLQDERLFLQQELQNQQQQSKAQMQQLMDEYEFKIEQFKLTIQQLQEQKEIQTNNDQNMLKENKLLADQVVYLQNQLNMSKIQFQDQLQQINQNSIESKKAYSLESQNEELIKNIEQQKQTIIQLQQNLSNLKMRFDQKEKELQDLILKYQNLYNQYIKDGEQNNNEILDKKDKYDLNHLKQSIDTLNLQLKQLIEEKENMKTIIKNQEEEINRLNEIITQENQKYSDLVNKINNQDQIQLQLQEITTKSQQDLRIVEQQLINKQYEIQQLDAENKKLNNKLIDNQNLIRRLQQELMGYGNEKQKLQFQYQQEISTLQSQIKKLQQQNLNQEEIKRQSEQVTYRNESSQVYENLNSPKTKNVSKSLNRSNISFHSTDDLKGKYYNCSLYTSKNNGQCYFTPLRAVKSKGDLLSHNDSNLLTVEEDLKKQLSLWQSKYEELLRERYSRIYQVNDKQNKQMKEVIILDETVNWKSKYDELQEQISNSSQKEKIIQQLRQQNEQLGSQLYQLQSDSQQLKTEIITYQKQLETEANQNNLNQKRIIDQQSQKIIIQQNEIDQLKQKLKQAAENFNTLQKKQNSQQNEYIKQLEAENFDYSQEIQSLQIQIKRLQENNNLQSQQKIDQEIYLKSGQNKFEFNQEEYEQQIEILKNEIKIQQTQIFQQQIQLKQAKINESELEQKWKSAIQELKPVQYMYNELRKSSSDLQNHQQQQQQKNTIETFIEEQSFNQQDDQYRKLLNELSLIKQQNSSLQDQLQESTQKQIRLMQEIKQLQIQNERLNLSNVRLHNEQQDISEKSNQINRVNEFSKELQAENQKQRSEIAQLQQEKQQMIISFEQKLQQYSASANSKFRQQQIEDLKRELAQLKRATLKSSGVDIDAERLSYSTSITQLKKQLEYEQIKNKELQQKLQVSSQFQSDFGLVERLNQELQDKIVELHSVKSEYKNALKMIHQLEEQVIERMEKEQYC